MRADPWSLIRHAVLLLVPPIFVACQGEPQAGAAGWTPAYVADHHVHILSPELVRDWKSLGVPFSRPDSAYTSVSAVFGDGATKAFLVSMAHVYGSGEFRNALQLSLETEHLRVREANDHVAAEVARNPGRFVGFCSVPLLRPYAEAEIERCRSAFHLAGLKLHLPASEISLARRDHLQLLSAVAARAARERRPVLIHLAPVEDELHEEEVRAFIDHVVDPHPDLELYLAHLGGNGGFRASARRSIRAFTTYLHANEANARREIYFELSGALLSRRTDGVPASRRSDARELMTELQDLGLERVLFGSDYPVFDALEFANLLYERLPLSHVELGQVMQQQAPAFDRQSASVTR